MRLKFLLVSWIGALVLLAWPVQTQVLGTDVSCGPAAKAFVSEVTTSGDIIERALDAQCADRAYGHVAAGAGVGLGATLLASLGWRKRRRRRIEQKKATRLGQQIMQRSNASAGRA